MKTNETCPSYDCGFCETFPAPFEVRCGGSETKNCRWLNFDFKYANYDVPKNKKTTMYDYIKTLSAVDFAYTVAIDNNGDCRGVCAICQRHIDGNCDDKCIGGIVEFLESEVKK